jgi:hypothetical protein
MIDKMQTNSRKQPEGRNTAIKNKSTVKTEEKSEVVLQNATPPRSKGAQ